MLLNSTSLRTLNIGFSTAFQNGLGQHVAQWSRVASQVSSTTRENEYGWIGQIPNVREWIGPRQVQNLAAHDYAIKNRKFELTVRVKKDDVEDDNLGMYGPMFTELGRSVAAHPDQLVWSLLAAGFSTACYDGQFYFDTDHPVLDAAGTPVSVANTDGGGGAAWFLIDDSRVLKPIIYQTRKAFELVAKDAPDDDNVFWDGDLVYGTDGRCNVGFGFWQFAWGSKQTLNKANYRGAREALMGMKGDYARPLGLMPRLLVVPPSLEGEALEILNAERDAAGATNVYKGTAELLVVPWLA
ncbi:MAG: Mu-like prophage major head subunit gpT family protein [Alphaproteobacteria bacterium]